MAEGGDSFRGPLRCSSDWGRIGGRFTHRDGCQGAVEGEGGAANPTQPRRPARERAAGASPEPRKSQACVSTSPVSSALARAAPVEVGGIERCVVEGRGQGGERYEESRDAAPDEAPRTRAATNGWVHEIRPPPGPWRETRRSKEVRAVARSLRGHCDGCQRRNRCLPMGFAWKPLRDPQRSALRRASIRFIERSMNYGVQAGSRPWRPAPTTRRSCP